MAESLPARHTELELLCAANRHQRLETITTGQRSMDFIKRAINELRGIAGSAYRHGAEFAMAGWPKRPTKLALTCLSTQREFEEHTVRTQRERARLENWSGP